MLQILGMGWALPKNELTNDFLHKEVGLEKGPEWVDSRLGIYRRFSVLTPEYIVKTKNRDPFQAIVHARAHHQTPVTLAVEAARLALAQAGIKASKIGWVVANNDTPFEAIPCTAVQVAKELGIGPGPHIDVNSACSSFARHMQLLADIRPSALPEYTLAIQSSAYTTRTDYSQKSSDGYIFGDGAAAQVVSVKHQGRLKVEPMIFETQASGADEIACDTTGHFHQNGALVREFSIRKTCEMYEAIAKEKHLYADEVYTVAHQANYTMQNSILGHLNLPQEKHLRNVHEQGNIAAAGCPSTIAQNLDRLQRGDKIVYAVLGAGLAWGGGLMEVQ